jgi:disulfide bond formation protein DsbB
MVNLAIKFFSIGTLLVYVFFALLSIFFIFKLQTNKKFEKYYILLQKHALFFAFLVALGAMFGSLFFSEIAHFEPCTLCWWQRVFLYPQVIILGVAFWNKDRQARLYTVPLSLIGACIAGYQYIITALAPVSPLGICSAAGPSCLTNYFTEFGFITSPFMSFTAFVFILVLVFSWKADYRPIA